MNPVHFILATAGHVDHGKSALVRALTGTDPDRLPEEKARGITIDLGFAHLELTGMRGETPALFSVGVVDVPGHEDFVKNMVAGVGSIDAALLVVAADDGWMPQTEEHLQILGYLGVTHGVVALTKIDLVPDLGARIRRVQERLKGTAFEQAPVVPVSNLTGQGLEQLRLTLADLFASMPAPCDLGKPRLAVDRTFTLKGIGTVVTGTLTGGTLRRGQDVVVQPGNRPARIRTLQQHRLERASGVPGTRTALNLPDPNAAGPGPGLRRGDVVTLPGLGAESRTLDVCLEKSSRLQGAAGPAARPLRDGARVWLHLGTTHTLARVVLAPPGVLEVGGRVNAQLRSLEPVFAFVGDRFIVRDASGQATIAGGCVLEPQAVSTGFRRPRRQAFLETRSAPGAVVSAEILIRSMLHRDGVVRREGLLAASRVSEAAAAGALAALAGRGELEWVGQWLVEPALWRNLRDRAATAVDTFHAARPEQAGLPLTDLRVSVEGALPEPALFDALVTALEVDGFVRAGAVLRRRTHRPSLPPGLMESGTRLRRQLGERPLDPPSRKDLAGEGPAAEALRFLVRTGEVVELSPEVVVLAEVLARARRAVVEHLRQKGAGTTSELRQLLGSSRRVVIPMLERFDREGLTRRDGDLRRLRNTAL